MKSIFLFILFFTFMSQAKDYEYSCSVCWNKDSCHKNPKASKNNECDGYKRLAYRNEGLIKKNLSREEIESDIEEKCNALKATKNQSEFDVCVETFRDHFLSGHNVQDRVKLLVLNGDKVIRHVQESINRCCLKKYKYEACDTKKHRVNCESNNSYWTSSCEHADERLKGLREQEGVFRDVPHIRGLGPEVLRDKKIE